MAYADRTKPLTWLLVLKLFRDVMVFSGRSTRSEALIFSLAFSTVVGLPAGIADDYANSLLVAAGLMLGIVINLPMCALLVRRLHDFDRSGWWALLMVLQFALMAALVAMPQGHGSFSITFLIWRIYPAWSAIATPMILALIALMIIELAIYFWPPVPGPNRYGPDPRL